MGNVKPSGGYYAWVIFVAAITLAGAIIFYSGLPKGNIVEWLFLGALMIYFHTFKVNIGTRMGYSLSTATIFPIVYLFGTTAGMATSAAAGLVDGLLYKKSWERTLFNMAQLAFCTLTASLVFQSFNGSLEPLDVRAVAGMGVGALVQIVANILIVTFTIALYTKTAFAARLRTIGFSGLYSSVGTGFIGLIFTLFVLSYGFWGLVAYSLLLIYLSELLKAAARISGERERRRELEEELEIDDMTKALNFRYLNRWLNDPACGHMAVLFIDIDDFKLFNDRYGHAQGDKVLKLLTKTIIDNIRADDKLIRYGGDEFVVLLPDMDNEGASHVAKRIQAKLRRMPYASTEQPITVSIGVAASPEDTTDKRQLLFVADQAMYAAKRAGKDRLCVYGAKQGSA